MTPGKKIVVTSKPGLTKGIKSTNNNIVATPREITNEDMISLFSLITLQSLQFILYSRGDEEIGLEMLFYNVHRRHQPYQVTAVHTSISAFAGQTFSSRPGASDWGVSANHQMPARMPAWRPERPLHATHA
jgi:hypothetical protein